MQAAAHLHLSAQRTFSSSCRSHCACRRVFRGPAARQGAVPLRGWQQVRRCALPAAASTAALAGDESPLAHAVLGVLRLCVTCCAGCCAACCAGEWLAGVRHGKGTCLYANGDKYQGGCQHVLSSCQRRQHSAVAATWRQLSPPPFHWARAALSSMLQGSGRRTSGTATACASLLMAGSLEVGTAVLRARWPGWPALPAC